MRISSNKSIHALARNRKRVIEPALLFPIAKVQTVLAKYSKSFLPQPLEEN